MAKFKNKIVEMAFLQFEERVLNISLFSCLGGGLISSGIGLISIAREDWLTAIGVVIFAFGVLALHYTLKTSNATIEGMKEIYSYHDDLIDQFSKKLEEKEDA